MAITPSSTMRAHGELSCQKEREKLHLHFITISLVCCVHTEAAADSGDIPLIQAESPMHVTQRTVSLSLTSDRLLPFSSNPLCTFIYTGCALIVDAILFLQTLHSIHICLFRVCFALFISTPILVCITFG